VLFQQPSATDSPGTSSGFGRRIRPWAGLRPGYLVVGAGAAGMAFADGQITLQVEVIDKISGKVAYAVISFGGFLGMGEDYYPLPWPNLKYDARLGGYRVGVTEDQLKGAPKYNRNTDWDWSDRARDRSVYDYYKTPLWY